MRAEGGTEIRRGADRLSAVRIYGNLSDDETGLKFVHAFWDIEGETHSEAPAAAGKRADHVRFKGGKDLAVVFVQEAKQPSGWSSRRRTTAAWRWIRPGGGIARTLTARAHRRVAGERRAERGRRLRQASRSARSRRWRASRRCARPPASAARPPSSRTASSPPWTSTTTSSTTTARSPPPATMGRSTWSRGAGEFAGIPVVVTSDRGRIEAPRMVYNTDQQIVNARGGVKALLQKVEETALAGTPLANGEGPVHVESQEAFWRQQPSSFIFRGDVRAWRGDNLLLAPELRGDKAADQLNATGGVKTLFYPTSEGKAARATRSRGAEAEADPGHGGRPPVFAEEGQGAREERPAALHRQRAGGPGGEDPHLPEDGGRPRADRQAKTMICTGDAKINDPKVGRKIDGQKALYQVSQRQIDITGEPVTMTDKDGNQVRGKRVLYYVDDGRAVVQGKEGEANPAPAIQTRPSAKPAKAGAREARQAAGERGDRRDDDRAVERKDRGGAEARDRQPAQGLPRPGGGAGRLDRGRPRRDRRAAGPQRRRQDDDLLHGGRADPARFGDRPARRRGHHRAADVPAGAARDQLSAAGAVGLPPHVGRGQPAGDLRDARPLARRAGTAHRPAIADLGLSKVGAPAAPCCRAASGGGSRSRAHWSSTRGISSSTSRSPGSTRSRCSTSRGSSGTSSRWASES